MTACCYSASSLDPFKVALKKNFPVKKAGRDMIGERCRACFIYSSAGSLDLRRRLGKCWYGVKLRF